MMVATKNDSSIVEFYNVARISIEKTHTWGSARKIEHMIEREEGEK